MRKAEEKKRLILNYVTQKCSHDGIPPTIREICEAVGLKSPSSVHAYLEQLNEEGLIKKDGNKKRCAMPVNHESTVNIPILGKVTAGLPILAIENLDGYVSMPTSKVRSGEYFALNVVGDSMKNAGILNGDIIVVRRTPVADNGDIIVALIDDEATVKRFYKEGGRFVLRPENSAYKPIILDELKVLGKVTSVIRHYEV
ncbi:MAG: transcriptional repressor LexA [Ruminococcaceae bacterium]|nr:transcriptional repressor LexA [Oscillospiraceae bacterium]